MEAELGQQVRHHNLRLHQREPLSNADARARAEWVVGEWFDEVLVLRAEALRVEPVWVLEVLGVVVDAVDGHPDAFPRLQLKAGSVCRGGQLVGPHALAVQRGAGRVHAQRL